MEDSCTPTSNEIPGTCTSNGQNLKETAKHISQKRKIAEPPCCTRQKCGLKLISLQTRKNLKQEYSEHSNTGQGFSYLRRYISPETVMNTHGKRRTTYRYYIPNGEDQIEVCQAAFRTVFGITEGTLRNARDERGKA